MKTFHLVRHADAARGSATVPDHDRALTPRGRDDASRLGTYLRDAGIVADLVLCSTARRAQETLELLGLPEVGWKLEPGLYEATADDLVDRLRAVPDDVGAVLLVGHNPAVQQLALRLAGAGSGLERLAATFPAGSLASFVTPLDRWAELSAGSAELSRFVVPGELE